MNKKLAIQTTAALSLALALGATTVAASDASQERQHQ